MMLSESPHSADKGVAGKLFNQGGTAKECLQPTFNSCDLNDDAKKNSSPSDLEVDSIVHKITHGMSTQPSIVAGELINPTPKTLFQQKLLDKKELLYSSKCTPLGRFRLARLPQHRTQDSRPDDTQPYGLPTVLDVEAGRIINPNKTRKQIEDETKAGHDLYVVTHRDYDVGEMYDRKYDWGRTNPKFTRFGVETPHYNDGRNMAETLRWMHKTPIEKTNVIVSKRLDDFRERTQPQLGKPHDPIADTLKTGPGHTYGVIVRPDKYGVGDLLHMRSPRNYLLGKDRKRGVLSIVRQQLKKANYHNFSDLKSAFKHYDTDGKGYLDAQKVRDACWKFNLPIDNDLLASLMHYCSVQEDSSAESEKCKLDYEKFVNFLNWKDKFSPPTNAGSLSKDEFDDDVTRLCKQIDKAMTNHITSSSAIDAVVGGTKLKEQRTYGVPTVRSDVPAPRIRRISDRTNYGEEYDAYGLVNPSIYTKHGVFERDFFEPRSRDEVKKIFEGIGVNITDVAFEKVWDLAVKWTGGLGIDASKASVEAFRVILDKIQAASLEDKQEA